jgi:hypothetical protein
MWPVLRIFFRRKGTKPILQVAVSDIIDYFGKQNARFYTIITAISGIYLNNPRYPITVPLDVIRQ